MAVAECLKARVNDYLAAGSDTTNFTFHDVILLMAFSFSLIGTTLRMSIADENGLRDAVHLALLRIVRENGDVSSIPLNNGVSPTLWEC